MEKNNFNKAYIYIIAIFAIGVAISNIISFFSGVGFALIGASVFLMLAIINILKDDEHKKRFIDIFVLIGIEFLMLTILFFAYDFNLSIYPQYDIENNFPLVMRNICAIYSLIAIGYIVFRYIYEIKGKRFTAVEFVLGNYTRDPNKKKIAKEKIKKNKELENGTLEPKPSSIEVNVEGDSEIEVVDDEKTEEQQADETKEEVVEQKQESTPTTTNRTNFWY